MTPQSTLKVGRGLVLPLDAVTETFGFIGNRGSGKTYGAKVVAEEMLKVRAQVVVLDPVDAWYGLRYGARRGSSGLPVYVFGGAHGDAPLEATAGALLADVVVEQGISAVFSMRHLPKQQQRRFVTDFATQLYLRKGEDRYRSAVHVFIEEAHTFAPQTQFKGEAVDCLGAIQDLVLQGRGSGIGVSLVTQRVATVSKAVLELVEVMFAFRTTGPNARKALAQWFAAQDGDDHLNEFLGAIPSLPRGECWLWSPGYLNLFKNVAIRVAETFDSSATPKGGARRVNPTGAPAKLDLKTLGDRIKETVERAEQNDPKKLQARIKELERELSKKPVGGTKVEEVVKVERVVETVRVEVLPPGVDELLNVLEGLATQTGDLTAGMKTALVAVRGLAKRKPKTHKPERIMEVTAPKVTRVTGLHPPQSAADTPRRSEFTDAVHLDRMPRKILAVLAQYPEGRTNRQLTTLTGYAYSGGFKNSLTLLRNMGYMTGGNTEVMCITDAGSAAVGDDWEPLPTGPDLLAWWMNPSRLQAMERMILKHLLKIHPKAMTGEDLAIATEYAYSGGFKNSLTKLRTLAIAEGGNTTGVRVTDDFYEAVT